MSKEVNISVNYVTRVEGHGNIVVNAKDGNIKKCEWQIIEPPRYFESLVVGRNWKELHHITSRICGICSIGHTLASLKATEKAMDIEISESDRLLRKLALHAETMQSHILHVGYLALPDLMNVGSVLPLLQSHPDEVKTVIRLHRLANEMSTVIAGRTMHPQRLIPGGFSKRPTNDNLKELKHKLEESIDDLKAVSMLLIDLVSQFPDFQRETEFISLTLDREYALYSGDILSSDTGITPFQDYLEITNEYVVPQSTAKYARHNRDSYMVGALARVNNNYTMLGPMAKEVAKMFDLRPMNFNPYMNNVAQLVEVVDSVENSIGILNSILENKLEPQEEYHQPQVAPKAGQGVGAVEVPRGILFHDYTYDKHGVCTEANCVIPTNQNHANIQKDMEVLLPQILDRPQDEIELTLEMLVRAYDPCISCSTHYLDVEFVNE